MRWDEYGSGYNVLCFHCGGEFYAVNDQSKYCSNKCRQKAYRVRKARFGRPVQGIGVGLQRECSEDAQFPVLVFGDTD